MTSAPRIGLVWAQAEEGVLGRDGGMPWHVPEDLAHFKAVTLGSPVVMGRGTWDSLAPRYRPLPGRRNIVITRQADWSDAGADVAPTVADALELAGSDHPEWIWVIGGGTIFAQTIALADRLEVTELSHPNGFGPHADDVRAPTVDPERFVVASVDPVDGVHASKGGVEYRFVRYGRSVSAEAPA